MLPIESKMMRPVLLKLGVALALTVAGYLYSHLRSKKVLPSLPPPPGGKVGGGPGLKEIQYSITPEKEEGPRNASKPGLVVLSSSSKTSGGEENLLLPEFNDLAQKDFESTCISPTMAEMDAYAQKSKLVVDPIEQEVINLRSMVRVLGERERNLEIQLLEYYGLKEQESAVRELGNRLKINTMEAKFFTLKIESLQAENKRLEAQVSEHAKVIAELESARVKIKQLKRKIKTDGEQSRDQLSLLQPRVAALQEEESRVAKLNAEVLKKVQMLKSLEHELVELKNDNSKLQCENLELATKLESTQILASSVFEDPEVKRMEEEVKHLQDANSELEKEIERLQTDRCTDVEELVYLRWVNACLRYELRNYQPSPGKTAAKDLSKNLSPKSEEKAKQLILEYANCRAGENTYSLIDFDSECGSSSQASTLTEAGELDDFLCDNSTQNRSSSSSSSKSKLFSKLKRLVSRKEGHLHHHHHHRHQHQHQHQHHRNSISSNRLSAVDGTDSSSVFSERRASISITSSGEYTGTNPNDRVSSYENRNSKSKSFTNLRILDRGTKEKAGVSIGTVSSYSDIQSLRKLSSVGNTETTDGDGHDDLGSQHEYKKMILGEGGAMESVADCRLNLSDDTPEKLELKKYAQALKSSRARLNVSKRPPSFAC